MSDQADRVDNLQDEEKKERRPVLLLLLGLLLLLCIAGTVAAVSTDILRQPEGQTDTATDEPTDEPITETEEEASFTPVDPTETVVTATFTSTATDTPTATQTDTPTPTATKTPTVTPTRDSLTGACTAACGDGFCCAGRENHDSCPADCSCVDDGVCSPTEGVNCRDCGSSAGTCGGACTDSSQCADGLSCFGGVCWNACTCGGDCGPTACVPNGTFTCTCTTGYFPPGYYAKKTCVDSCGTARETLQYSCP